MLFKVSPDIFRTFPGVTFGVIVAKDIENEKVHAQVKDLTKETQDIVQKKINREELATHPHIVPWLEAYKKFGANPKKYMPSVQNLAERSLKKGVPSINTLVDLYNAISLKYLLPAGGEDLDTIHGDIQLACAGAQESSGLLLGDKEVTRPEPGEVIYKDAESFICRRWNWKEADRTKLTPATKNAFLILEALPPVDQATLEAALNELALLIERFCGGTVSVAIINEKNPEVTLKKAGIYEQLQPVQKISTIAPEEIYKKRYQALEAEAALASNEHKLRIEKIERMRSLGIEPWPAGKEVDATAQQVMDEFDETVPSRVYHCAGRLMTFREHGKTAFAHIQDRTGRLQIYLRQDDIGQEAFDYIKQFVDIGDIIWVKGHSFKTKTGEITLKAQELVLLSKCLYPLPEKFHGLTDVETAYRQRYLDLISNPESRNRFITRSHIVRAIRTFFDAHDFMEVETPMLQVIPGGAAAKPFITHHNALNMDLYLRIAPELYLKRLVVGGLERVYEINRNFRNEGISTKHNPEFTMLEFYIAYKDYHFAMDFVEQLLRTVAMQIGDSLQLPFGQHILDFSRPFARLSMFQAVKQYGNFSDKDLSEENIDQVLKKHSIKIDNTEAVWGHKLYALFEAFVEPNLVQPTFITHFPIEVSPLAKRDPQDSRIAARFELFIAGVELSNGFNELNDPFDQADRFKDQAKARSAGDIEAHHYDADFVQALEYALPPTAGVGIGIDRLTMFLTNTTSIKDVILFPTLKKRE